MSSYGLGAFGEFDIGGDRKWSGVVGQWGRRLGHGRQVGPEGRRTERSEDEEERLKMVWGCALPLSRDPSPNSRHPNISIMTLIKFRVL
jgi:hypothetical protein